MRRTCGPTLVPAVLIALAVASCCLPTDVLAAGQPRSTPARAPRQTTACQYMEWNLTASRQRLDNPVGSEVLFLNSSRFPGDDAFSLSCTGSSLQQSDLQTMELDGHLLFNREACTTQSCAFSATSQTGSVDISHNELDSLITSAGTSPTVHSVFSAFSNIQELDVSYNRLTRLSPGTMYGGFPGNITFAAMRDTQILWLDNNQITMVASSVFNPFEGLVALDLSHNFITSLPVGVFALLGRLKDLFLTTLNQGPAPFEWPDLEPVSATLLQLRLDMNNITEISSGALDHMTMLESLRIQRNRLSYVAAGPLDALTSLTDLRLNYNEITGVADFAFKDLANVERIRLYDNNLTAVPQRAAWANLGRVEQIDLLNNSISVIPSYAFSYDESPYANRLNNLDRLYMSFNPIWAVSMQIFGYQTMGPDDWRHLTNFEGCIVEGCDVTSSQEGYSHAKLNCTGCQQDGPRRFPWWQGLGLDITTGHMNPFFCCLTQNEDLSARNGIGRTGQQINNDNVCSNALQGGLGPPPPTAPTAPPSSAPTSPTTSPTLSPTLPPSLFPTAAPTSPPTFATPTTSPTSAPNSTPPSASPTSSPASVVNPATRNSGSPDIKQLAEIVAIAVFAAVAVIGGGAYVIYRVGRPRGGHDRDDEMKVRIVANETLNPSFEAGGPPPDPVRSGRPAQRPRPASPPTPTPDEVTTQVRKAMAQFETAARERVALKEKLGQIQVELKMPNVEPAKKNELVTELERLYREFARLDMVQEPILGGPPGTNQFAHGYAGFSDPLGLLDDDMPPGGAAPAAVPDGFFPAPTFDRGLESVVESLYATGIFASGGEVRLPEMFEPTRVEMLDEIGRGSCALIRRGRLKTHGQPGLTVAVKIGVPNQDDFNKNWDKIMTEEAAVMSQLEHPHVLKLMGTLVVGKNLVLVTEFCAHLSLQILLRSKWTNLGQHAPALVHKIASEIASGMTYLAGRGYIHRDLASRNVLVDENLSMKIADFGMTRKNAGRSDSAIYYKQKTETPMPMRWMSPEAIYMKFSEKSDVWSYGVVLYEVHTSGETPYSDIDNIAVAIHVNMGRRLPKLGEVYCIESMRALMDVCWEKEPDDRPRFDEILLILERDKHLLPDPAELADFLHGSGLHRRLSDDALTASSTT